MTLGDPDRPAESVGGESLAPTLTEPPELAIGRRTGAEPDETTRNAAPDGTDDLALGMNGADVLATPDRFVGETGSIRGHVEVAGGEPFPRVWRLLLSPSTTLIGRETAIEKVVDFTDGRQDFEVEGLPLGGYDVRAEAAGMNGQSQGVLLEQRSPGTFINLRMIAAGFVAGKVIDANGAPADGVVVTLVEMPSRASREETTDALGDFRFEDVLDGAYQFLVGRFENPILKDARTLRVQAPGMTLPDIELPVLAALEFTILDPTEDRLLSDVVVRGSGTNGGMFEGRTDSFGRFTARHLPAGRWRLRLELDGYGGRRDAVDLVAGETMELSLGLARE